MVALMKKKDKQKSQIDKFVDTARQLKCDESEPAFNEKLKKLVKPKKLKGKK